ncbi:MAG TPA: hypothetical protein VFY24_00055 [Azospira sp.]|nr:hypothetical protein [Azospira sp.]
MKVTSTSLPPVARELARESARPAAAGRKPELPAAADAAAQQAPAAAKNAGTQEAKAVPPGLEKVQARLQEITPEDRTRGQSTALASIERNIARYAEQQAAVPTAQETPDAPETPTSTVNTLA